MLSDEELDSLYKKCEDNPSLDRFLVGANLAIEKVLNHQDVLIRADDQTCVLRDTNHNGQCVWLGSCPGEAHCSAYREFHNKGFVKCLKLNGSKEV